MNLKSSGKNILCTRPLEDAGEFKAILENSGAEVIVVPMIEIHSAGDFKKLDLILENIDNYKGLIFTSSNGVKHFFKRAGIKGVNPALKIYAVGEKTARAAEDFGYKVSLIPLSYNSASLAKLLSEKEGNNSNYLFPSGNLSMKGLLSGLKNVEEIVVYETGKPAKTKLYNDLEVLLKKNKIDCIAFFSPSAVSNFAELYPDYREIRADIAAIGNTTLSRIKEIGLNACIIAKKATGKNLAEEIINYYNER